MFMSWGSWEKTKQWSALHSVNTRVPATRSNRVQHDCMQMVWPVKEVARAPISDREGGGEGGKNQWYIHQQLATTPLGGAD